MKSINELIESTRYYLFQEMKEKGMKSECETFGQHLY